MKNEKRKYNTVPCHVLCRTPSPVKAEKSGAFPVLARSSTLGSLTLKNREIEY